MAIATPGRKTKTERKGLQFPLAYTRRKENEAFSLHISIVEVDKAVERKEKLSPPTQGVYQTYPGLGDLFYLEEMA